MMQKDTQKRPAATLLAIGGVACLSMGILYAAAHTGQQAAPIKLGTSGGSVKDITASYCCSGTLGSQVKDATGKKFILSNNHVLADSNAGVAGDGIMQRGYVDTVPPCSKTGTIIVANLSKFVPISFTANNSVDAAIAAVAAGKVATNGAILGIGAISAATKKATVGLAVQKSGRSGVSSGSVSQVGVTVTVTGYGVCGCGQAGQPACKPAAKFVGQMAITPGTFIQTGDSGSLVLNKPAGGTKPNAVGLIFAGSSTLAVANPIGAVLKKFSVTMDAETPTPEEIANAADVDDPEVDAALLVNDKYDDHLFTLPEVVGHGVGKDTDGHAVITLFLRQATDAARQVAPTALDGIPVQLLETGEFHTTPTCSSCATCKTK